MQIARPFLGDEPFIMYLGDNILRDGVKEFVDTFNAGDANAQILAARVPEPQRFGVIEAIQKLIDRNLTVHWQKVRGWWKDTGHLDDLLDANRVVLSAIEERIEVEADAASRIEGNVVVEPGTSISRSIIRGPAVIGRDCYLDNAYIGPYTSLADGVRVVGAELEHCIVLQRASIENVARRIDASLIGREARVFGTEGKPKTHRLMVGDSCTVGIGE